ncbi:MAG: ferredoxin reductase family protein [Planctomycetes bacterium]|nr:ferredoxin reductase family protein [Planctomycetota bacterium]MCW8135654.1 ferredoxin reductase family protein [Planctomycetota bacterium]
MTGGAHFRQAVFWVGLYAALALAPLALALAGYDRPARPFWVEFGVGLGFVGLSMMALQFVLTARFKGIAAPFGTDAMLQFHRQAGLVACAFVAGHVLVLIAARPGYVAFFDPRVNLMRAGALVTVLLALAGIVGLTLLRKRLRFPYEWWRLTHGLLSLLVILISLAHVQMVGRYVSTVPKRALWAAMCLGAMSLLLYPRLVKPFLARKRPYRVVDVKPETPRVWTITLEAEGHEGLRFTPGQFAWLTLGGSPFALKQHPFTFASSAEQRGRYSFTIKELGDFTSKISSVAPGTRAWLDGPHGAFTPGTGASALVLIAGGIGVTPMMSILRSMKDRGDTRPATLIYGAGSEAMIAFRAELEALAQAATFKFVPVVENPGEGWQGERGVIDDALLTRHLPPDDGKVEYMICGPDAMMDAVELLLIKRGVPMRRRHSERFNIA